VLPKLLPDVSAPVAGLAAPPPPSLRECETVFEALARIRREPGAARILHFYVTDDDGRLVGIAPARGLLLADPATLVGELMQHPVYSIVESASFGAALPLLAFHRLLALPVVDGRGRLTGILDVSAATRALVELERGESDRKLFQTIGMRGGRQPAAILAALAAGLAMTVIAAAFHGVLGRAPAIAFFIPAILATAACAAFRGVGRGFEGTIPAEAPRDLALSVVLAAAVAGLVGLMLAGWLGAPIAVAVSLSLSLAALEGAALGRYLPRFVHRRGFGPGIASGPVVTFLAAALALLCYLATSALLV